MKLIVIIIFCKYLAHNECTVSYNITFLRSERSLALSPLNEFEQYKVSKQTYIYIYIYTTKETL